MKKTIQMMLILLTLAGNIYSSNFTPEEKKIVIYKLKRYDYYTNLAYEQENQIKDLNLYIKQIEKKEQNQKKDKIKNILIISLVSGISGFVGGYFIGNR